MKKKPAEKARVIIEFPSKEAAKRFLGWFSDGGGESNFFESEEVHADDEPIKRMDYAKAFPAWGYDPQKDGPDLTVTASL